MFLKTTRFETRDPELVNGLGWFSLGLGSTQLIAPGALNRLIGAPDDPHSRFWQRVVGVQELSAATGILGRRQLPAWLWGRTAGDVLHMTMVARTYGRPGARPVRLTATLVSLAGTLAADAYASARISSKSTMTSQGTRRKATASITVYAPVDVVQERWREFEERGGDARLGPIELVGDASPGSITWRTGDSAGASASGRALFSALAHDRGTEVRLELEYRTLGGAVGAAVQKIMGDDPHQMAQDDLRRFKQLVEAGEIARSDGAPTGHTAEAQPKQRPARPLEQAQA